METTTIITETLDFDKVWFMFQETDKEIKATKALLEHSSLETRLQFQDTDRE